MAFSTSQLAKGQNGIRCRGVLRIAMGEWKFSDKKKIQNAAKLPHVSFGGVAMGLGGQQLRGGAREGGHFSLLEEDGVLGGNATVGGVDGATCGEVDELEFKGKIVMQEEHVVRTDIPVNNAGGVEKTHGLEQGGEERASQRVR